MVYSTSTQAPPYLPGCPHSSLALFPTSPNFPTSVSAFCHEADDHFCEISPATTKKVVLFSGRSQHFFCGFKCLPVGVPILVPDHTLKNPVPETTFGAAVT